MLCQFTFRNYKPYRDETTLDFCATTISEHKEHLIIEPISGEEFLPIAAIYGPNGGGKSSVIDAYRYLRAVILMIDSRIKVFETNERSDAEIGKVWNYIRRGEQISFMFNQDQIKSPTGWSLSFIVSGFEYKYMLSLVNNRVDEESLYVKNIETGKIEKLFERNHIIEVGEFLSHVQTDKINAAMPLLSFISALYDDMHINNVMRFFNNTRVIDYSRIYGDIHFYPLLNDYINDNDTNKKTFINLLAAMGIDIDDLEIKIDSDNQVRDVYITYKYDNKTATLDLRQESSGTRKIFSVLVPIILALKTGSVLFADELDAKLHPKLLEYILSLYTDSSMNTHGAQLIITSHDLHTLNSKFLRRDEIWFAAKRDDYSSYLYSLSDFKKISSRGKTPRKDENYAKQYIEGRYGADPYFQKIEYWTVKE